MTTSFECLFEKYKSLLVKYQCSPKSAVDQSRKWTLIIVIGFAVVLYFVLVFVMKNLLCTSLATGMIGCCIILFANINPYPSSGPDEQPYLDHINRVKVLLMSYGIENNDTQKIQWIIDYANMKIARRDPLKDVKRAFAITGSIAAIVVVFISGALTGTLSLQDSILYVFFILGVVFLGALFSPYVSGFLSRILFPDKEKYQKLIDDLNNILMFEIKTKSCDCIMEN